MNTDEPAPAMSPMQSVKLKENIASLPMNNRHTTGNNVVNVERMERVKVLCSDSLTIDLYNSGVVFYAAPNFGS